MRWATIDYEDYEVDLTTDLTVEAGRREGRKDQREWCVKSKFGRNGPLQIGDQVKPTLVHFMATSPPTEVP